MSAPMEVLGENFTDSNEALTTPCDILMIDMPDDEFLVRDDQVVQLVPASSTLLRAIIRGGGSLDASKLIEKAHNPRDIADALWLLEYDLEDISGCTKPILVERGENLTYRLNPELRIAVALTEDVPRLVGEGLITDEQMVMVKRLAKASDLIRYRQLETERIKAVELAEKLERRKLKNTNRRSASYSLRSIWDSPQEIIWTEDSLLTAEQLKLIGENLPLVKYVISNLFSYLPSHVDREELAQAGFFGLMDCAERYDPSYENLFSTFAIPRIRGAILDHMRELDYAPRTVRLQARKLDRAKNDLALELGRWPTYSELAEKLEVDQRTISRIEKNTNDALVLSIDEQLKAQGQGEELSLSDAVPDPIATRELEEVDHEASNASLRRLVDSLPSKERLVISEYYFNGRHLAAIGKMLGVSESRACQINANALRLLRAKIDFAGHDMF